MKKILSIVMLLTLILTGCGEVPSELTNVGVYKDCQLELKEATTYATDEGENMLRVHAVYTNNGAEPLYAACSFAVRAFQNDVELDECSDINGDEEALIREIKDGQSLEVYFVFKLSDESEVEVLIGTPTADMDTIGREVYLSAEE